MKSLLDWPGDVFNNEKAIKHKPLEGGAKMKTKNILGIMVFLAASFCFINVALTAPGAIYTTDIACAGVDLNIYGDKEDVYLNGGPAGGGPGLPDGSYYAKVTEPDGTILGKSLTAVVNVSGGAFVQCYQLSAILYSASSGYTSLGYDNTTNAGYEYKVWVSMDDTFPNDKSKTDNFKVKSEGGQPPAEATLNVIKFYDANANGLNDDGQLITGWKIQITDDIEYIRYTPVMIILDPGTYVVTEFDPVEPNWFNTTPNSVTEELVDKDEKTIEFGNLCLGAGGGLTLGFWSNKNGQKLFGADDLAMLVSLNLREAGGSDFDPTDYASFRTWLLSANAANMAYMLSAQLAAMELNVLNGKVNGGALIYAPGTTSANALGFATVTAIMAEANTELGVHGTAYSGDAWRSYQEALKNALDEANNNKTFVQPTPCPFTFPPDAT
jgi:hypothetical protein